jgi:membrane-bound serine protease (ClpP class)
MKASFVRGWGGLAAALFLFLLFRPSSGTEAQVPAAGQAPVWIIPIRGDIEPSMTAFVRREVRKAQSQGAVYIIFEIDTFGGRVDSALQITSFITSIKNIRTIAWVNNGEASMGVSWSAGALIAFSCGEIYMAQGTSMGAAAPVSVGPGGAMEATGEKTVAAVRSQMAALAERNGHPVGIALAMVDVDVELWEATVDGETKALALGDLEALEASAKDAGAPKVERVRVISAPGKLLSLTAGEAYRYGLAAGLADSRENLLSAVGAGGALNESNPSAADGIITLLTSGPIQVILILIGLVMIFLEIQSPGFGIPGVTAIIAFVLVFGSGILLGRVGSLEILLFLVGIALLALELFVFPGFGVVGISGFLLIGLSLVLSMQDFVIPRFDWEWTLLGRNLVVVAVSLIASVAGIAVIALLGPRIRLFDRLTLKAQIVGTAGGPPVAGEEDEGEEDYAALVGKIGVADSVLRPSGKAVFDGKVYDVEADTFIESGKGIIITRVRGNRIIVKRV